jgi:Fe-Mn family superoxide dismutase
MITLPPLLYPYNALEPYIDEQTMHIHHDKHHQAYIDKLNALYTQYPMVATIPLEEALHTIDSLPLDEVGRTTLRNHGGGHINHSFFWTIIGPKKQIDTALVTHIQQTFGSLDLFKKQFTEKAMSHFGSGWMWLVENDHHELELYSTKNQDSPYLFGHTPKIGLDLWEHAYYLQYQNRRIDYINAWWNILITLPT